MACTYLRTKYGFLATSKVFEDGLAYETDDMIASYAAMLRSSNTPHIVCSNDKDLDQIPGLHMNPKTHVMSVIDDGQANYSLWTQALIGDSTDNIPGKPKCGPKSAENILGECIVHGEYVHGVLHAYIDHYGEMLGIKYFHETYQLVKLVDNIVIIPVDDYLDQYLTL